MTNLPLYTNGKMSQLAKGGSSQDKGQAQMQQ
jgi:hypothetical protein